MAAAPSWDGTPVARLLPYHFIARNSGRRERQTMYVVIAEHRLVATGLERIMASRTFGGQLSRTGQSTFA